ncbi:MAG: NAD(P)-dependent dehydrogenase, short-chain alcohol dehydrogenase family [Hyphomicrobiales bacterium]|nr:NAD(P)-dependent dehydrogenase, short-chain alcohol dehydrogenase family [Hyphomicrobiales bacterium]
MNPNGHVAVVTGGASGLGEATARRLAAAGAKVAIVDRNLELGQKVAAEIGGRAYALDVSDAAGAEAFFKQLADDMGVARILVNCAGIAVARRIVGREGPHTLDEFAKVITVNLIGTFNMMRLMAAALTQIEPLAGGERGVIVSTASVAALEGQIGQAAYAASKGGVVALTLPAAREFAQFGIRVLALAPGLFLTPLLAQLPQAAQDSLAAAIPFPPRLGLPDEFAALAMHCVENSFLNGEVIRLDGALRMAPK